MPPGLSAGGRRAGLQESRGAAGAAHRDGTAQYQFDVVGVVQDVRFTSPPEEVAPHVYTFDTHGFQHAEAAVRYRGVPRAEMMERLKAASRSLAPDNPFVAKTAEEPMADFFEPDRQRAPVLRRRVLAVAIARLGLCGLASFNTARRVKEIGICKDAGRLDARRADLARVPVHPPGAGRQPDRLAARLGGDARLARQLRPARALRYE